MREMLSRPLKHFLSKAKAPDDGSGIDVSIDGERATNRKRPETIMLSAPPSSKLRPFIEPKLRPRLGAATVKVTGASASKGKRIWRAMPSPTYPQGIPKVSSRRSPPRIRRCRQTRVAGMCEIETQQRAHPWLTLSPDDHVLFQHAPSVGDARVRLEAVDPCRCNGAAFGGQYRQLRIQARKQVFHEVFDAVEGTENGDHGRGNCCDHKHRDARNQMDQALRFPGPEIPAGDAKRYVHLAKLGFSVEGS